jgi:hypothetical protein
MKQLVCRSMVHPHQQFPGIAQCLNPALSLSSRSQVWTSFCQRRIASTLCRCGRAFDNGIVEVIGNDSRLLLTFGIVQNSEQLRAAGRAKRSRRAEKTTLGLQAQNLSASNSPERSNPRSCCQLELTAVIPPIRPGRWYQDPTFRCTRFP